MLKKFNFNQNFNINDEGEQQYFNKLRKDGNYSDYKSEVKKKEVVENHLFSFQNKIDEEESIYVKMTRDLFKSKKIFNFVNR